jgi:hypothetical protein
MRSAKPVARETGSRRESIHRSKKTG